MGGAWGGGVGGALTPPTSFCPPGLQVILDLTPTYSGEAAWFGPEVAEDPGFHEKVKVCGAPYGEGGVWGSYGVVVGCCGGP